MSDADVDEFIVSADGVSVRKRLRHDHDRHVAVVFEIESTSDEPITLEIVDEIDPEYPIGFHPDFGGQHWTLDNDQVSYRNQIAPGERAVTVYAIGYASGDDVATFRSEPSIRIEPTSSTESDSVEAVASEQASDQPNSMEDAGDRSLLEVSDEEDPGADGEVPLEELFEFSPEDEAVYGATSTEETDESIESEAVTVTADEVTVVTRAERQLGDQRSIVYEVTSDQPTSAVVRLQQTLPASVSSSALEFPLEHGGVHWRRTGDGLVFQRLFAPKESVTTVIQQGLGAEGNGGSISEAPTVSVEPAFNRGRSPARSSGSNDREADWSIGSIFEDLTSTSPEPDPNPRSPEPFGEEDPLAEQLDDEHPAQPLESLADGPETGGSIDDLITNLLSSLGRDSAVDPIERLLQDVDQEGHDQLSGKTDGGIPPEEPGTRGSLDGLLADDPTGELLGPTDPLMTDEFQKRERRRKHGRTSGWSPGTQASGPPDSAVSSRIQAPDEWEYTTDTGGEEELIDRLASIETRLKELETAIAHDEPDLNTALDGFEELKNSIQSIESRLTEQDRPRSSGEVIADRIRTRVDEAHDAVRENRTAIAELRGRIESQLDAIRWLVTQSGRLAHTEDAPSDRQELSSGRKLTELDAEINAIKSAMASMMESHYQVQSDTDSAWMEIERVVRSQEAIEEELAELSSSIEALEARIADDEEHSNSQHSE